MGKDLRGKELGKGFCQRKDGRYVYRYTSVTGERKDIYEYSLTKLRNKVKDFKKIDLQANADDEYFLDNNLIKLRQKIRTEKKKRLKEEKLNDITCDKLYSEWVDYKQTIDKVTKSTIFTYNKKYDKFIAPEFGKKKYRDAMTVKSLNQFIISQVKERPSTATQLVVILKGMAHYIFLNGYSEEDLSLKITRGKAKKTDEKKVITFEQYNTLVKSTSNIKLKNMLIISYNTGMRISELKAITNKSIDLDNRLIHVDFQIEDIGGELNFSKPKNKMGRIVPINNECYSAIISQMEYNAIHESKRSGKFKDLLFTAMTDVNNPYMSAEGSLYDLIEKIGNGSISHEWIGVSFHSFRHAFITNCVEKGINISVIQEIAGHSSVNMTKHYTHISKDFIQKEFQKNFNFI